MSDFGEHTVKEAHKAFQYADRAQSGSLNRKDYKVAMVALFGRKPGKHEMGVAFSCVNNQEVRIKEDKFVRLVKYKVTNSPREAIFNEFFNLLDEDRKGYVTSADFEYATKETLPHLRPSLTRESFQEVACRNCGRVTRSELIAFLFPDMRTPRLFS